MSGFRINTPCIKSIKASYKDKMESNKHMRDMDEYQAAEKETGGKTGTGLRVAAPKEQPLKKVGRLCPNVPMALLPRISQF